MGPQFYFKCTVGARQDCAPSISCTDKVNYSFKTICSHTTIKNSRNLSILPIQLIKKVTFSWIWRPYIQIPLMFVQRCAYAYFSLTKDTTSCDRLLTWIRKKRGPKIEPCGTSKKILIKFKHVILLTISLKVSVKRIHFYCYFDYKHITYKINQKIITQVTV